MKTTKREKKNFIYLICTTILLPTLSLFGAKTTNISTSLREILSNDDSPRFSGKGTYIHTIYRKAIDVNDFLEGKKFKDEQSKQQYLMVMRITKGLDFSSKKDETTHTLERLYFDQNKKRRDYTSLSPAEAENIRNKTSVIDSLSLKTFTFDGDKTISLVNPERPDGTIDNYANILPGKMYFPRFQQFGHNCSEKSQKLIDSIDQGTATVEQSIIDGQVYCTLKMADGGVRMEFIFAPDKGMSRLYTGLYVNNQLQQEIVCQDYAQTSSGEWFPREYISNKYAYVRDERILTSSERFEALPGTVEFNISIEPSIFTPRLPEGTHVIDDRYRPPLEYVIESPNLEIFVEPLLKEKTLSHISEKLSENSDNSDLNNSKVVGNIDKGQARKIFIPEIETAIKHRKPFMFDLSSSKLVLIFVSKGNEEEKSHNSLIKLGKGDIAWDGSLVTVRNAKAFTVSQGSHRPLKCTTGKWRNSYSLPDKVDLPYSVLILTSESVYYFITIHEITSHGIWITYRKLSDDEAKHYCANV